MAENQAAEPTAVASPKILVVDDEIGIRRGCERVLRTEGYQVLLAESAEQGLDVLRQHPDAHLALVDLRMTGMGGMEFLSQAGPVASETVFLVITAYATLDAAVEAIKRGAYDFVAKPFTPDELLRVVNRALDRARLIRERNRLEEDRRRRLLELAAEKGRLRTVIDCMAEGVLVCNAQQELILYNPSALKTLLRVQPGQEPRPVAESAQSAELVGMVAEVSQQGRRLSRQLKLATEPLPGSEPRPNGGKEEWLLADVAPVTDPSSGQFLGTVTVLQDITEQKQVEQVKARFVNMVAHELRSPLAAIDGYLAAIQTGAVPDAAKQQEILGRSRTRLKALTDLVNDLLNVARMESGTVRREIAPQSIGEVANEVAELMRPLADQRHVRIEAQVARSLPVVEADHEELIRLLSNLLSNAIKYNKPEGRVSIRVERDGHYVKVSVADTGLGISKDGLSRLFSEFFREKRSETMHVTGTGLGLSIVKRIVDFYHGRIDVQSELGKGTTFTVWLPFSRGAEGETGAMKGN